MSDHDIVAEWLQIAFEDYDAARYLFDTKHPKPLEIICYHCQQSVEKALKAYLCFKDVEIPNIHATRLLCRQCADLNNDFSVFLESCAELEIYATGTRYPNRIEIEGINAETALRQTSEIYHFVAKLLGEASNKN